MNEEDPKPRIIAALVLLVVGTPMLAVIAGVSFRIFLWGAGL